MIRTRSNEPVSRICFGTLTVSPLQKNYAPERAGELFAYAHARGINFYDTAELYDNYSHLSALLRCGASRDRIVLATKSYAYDRDTLLSSVDKALREIGTDYLDIFLLHEQESEHTIRGHRGALDELAELKRQGVVRYAGLSTHYVSGVRGAVKYRDLLDALHPIVNIEGLGIQDGTVEEMRTEVARFRTGKTECLVYGMKIFGGGNLLRRAEEGFRFALECGELDAFAIGMSSEAEVDYNLEFVRTGGAPKALLPEFREKTLHIADWCIGCGRCVERCDFGALSVSDGRARVDRSRCVTCGYCSAVCPEFCIKVY